MTNFYIFALGFLSGTFFFFGIVAVLNFIIQKMAMPGIQRQADERHQDAVKHWNELDDIWRGILDEMMIMSRR